MSGGNKAQQGVEKAGNFFKQGLGALFGTEGAGDHDSDEEKR